MPDAKISALSDGGLGLPTDELVIARGGTSQKLDLENLMGGYARLRWIDTASTPYTVTKEMSGTVFWCSYGGGAQIFNLPTDAQGGATYTFVNGQSGSGEIHVKPGGTHILFGKSSAAENGVALQTTPSTGVLKNTAATNAVGDFVRIVYSPGGGWAMLAVAGAWSAT